MKYNSHFKTFLISETEENILENIYSKYKNEFQISFKENFNINEKKFEIFSHYSEIKILSCFDITIENQNFQIAFINLDYRFVGGKHGDSIVNENQIWGFKKLQQDYGKLLIREENYFDKILEIFNKTEIDFKDDKEFSDRFFVLTDHENNAKRFLNNETKKALTEIPTDENFILEISNNELIIGNKKPINQLNFNQIVNFLKFNRN